MEQVLHDCRVNSLLTPPAPPPPRPQCYSPRKEREGRQFAFYNLSLFSCTFPLSINETYSHHIDKKLPLKQIYMKTLFALFSIRCYFIVISCWPFFVFSIPPATRFNIRVIFQTFLKSSFTIQIEKYYRYIFIKLL